LKPLEITFVYETVENGITNLETKDGLSSDSLHKPMLKGMISHPSSITSQIAPGTPELWSFNCPKFYQISCPFYKSNSFH